MTPADVGMILDIERRAYAFPWTEQILHDCIDEGYDCWLLLLGEELVGYVVYAVALDEAHLLNLCIVPQRQGQGLGRDLLDRVLDRLRARRLEAVFLEVRVSNRVALGLYRSQGFTEVGYRKDYYPHHEEREDAVVMKLELKSIDGVDVE
jgi:[ribosomal protein S18]-alanine N-acetyltransferase